MERQPVRASTLPPYWFRAPCPQCGWRGEGWVMFDRNCPAVDGDHYHQRCGKCLHGWLSQCASAGKEDQPAADRHRGQR